MSEKISISVYSPSLGRMERDVTDPAALLGVCASISYAIRLQVQFNRPRGYEDVIEIRIIRSEKP